MVDMDVGVSHGNDKDLVGLKGATRIGQELVT